MSEASVSKVTPETLALMVELLPTVMSLRDLCAVTGLRLDTVRRNVAPFLAIMKLQGSHPKCGCGRDRFHPYGCTDSYSKGMRKGTVPGRTAEQAAEVLGRRQRVIDMLLAGCRFVDINSAMGFKHKDARKYLRFLTPDQITARADAIKARGPIPAKQRPKKAGKAKGATAVPEPVRPFSDPLYARISAAVPRWLTPATRDDVISEMYIAICDGTLREDDIEARAKRFASVAAAQFESRYGPISIDMPRWDQGGTTIGECIPDPQALAAFNHMFEQERFLDA